MVDEWNSLELPAKPTLVSGIVPTSNLAGKFAPQWLDLLRQARTGSDIALGQILEQCRGYLTAIAKQELSQQLQVKVAPSDIVQDSLLEAYRGFGRFDGTSEQELLGWLRTTLLNNVADAVKRYRGTARRAIDRERSLDADDSSNDAMNPPAAMSSLPVDKAIRAEERERMLLAIRCLPERQRRAVVLRNLEACSFTEIGSKLGISSEAARKLWERAVARLCREIKFDDAPSPIL